MLVTVSLLLQGHTISFSPSSWVPLHYFQTHSQSCCLLLQEIEGRRRGGGEWSPPAQGCSIDVHNTIFATPLHVLCTHVCQFCRITLVQYMHSHTYVHTCIWLSTANRSRNWMNQTTLHLVFAPWSSLVHSSNAHEGYLCEHMNTLIHTLMALCKSAVVLAAHVSPPRPMEVKKLIENLVSLGLSRGISPSNAGCRKLRTRKGS